MGKRWWSPGRWQAAAIGMQLAVVGALGVVGWQLLHPAHPGGGVTIREAVPGVTAAPGGSLTEGARFASPATSAAPKPGLPELVARVNRDDARLYRGQWASIQLVVQATGRYLVQHVMPLLLAAARGGGR
ncbi:MAG: hypothetical protein NVSMB17_14380 [Candidatus Dormibacteria bacterium]